MWKSTWTDIHGRKASMRNTRFSETEIVYAVKQLEMGISIKEIARKYGVCENTVYR
jgi:transposase-like protein